MKNLKDAYLTGIEDVDKYLIKKPRLLGEKLYEYKNQRYIFYNYLNSILTLEQYKEVLETYYPEDYKAIINQFAQDKGASRISYFFTYRQDYEIALLKNFTLTCIRADVYTEEIVEHLLWSHYTKPVTKTFVEELVKNTKNKELLKPLAHHVWFQVREVLAENGLFLDQLAHDRSKAVRKIVQEQLNKQSTIHHLS